ncbi:MAG: peroxide stress protein YaaA [Lachnospiraceae bacterium]|nr:peroxide stress protein YaaA [Lachnospiraceae bacterium]
MRIILSPAKKMNNTDHCGTFGTTTRPQFLEQTEEILHWLQAQSSDELKALWKCNDKILEQNVARLEHMDLEQQLTPAVLSYEGIAFQYMAPAVFETEHFQYLQEHLRILSAFYGVLRPMDGVTPYRLEMQAKAAIGSRKNLYELWGSRLYEAVRDDSGIIINLASKEYSKCIEKYLTEADRYITITFCEKSGEKLVTKGTYAKMARGEMVRFMAENHVQTPEELQKFCRLGYVFRKELSSRKEFVFERVERNTKAAVICEQEANCESLFYT